MASGRAAQHENFGMKSKRIHVVEDDSAIVDGLVSLVSAEGGDVYAWPSAEQFLSRAELRSGDVVLVDIDLPGKWGDELCQDLAVRGVDVRVIAMSGLPKSVLKPILQSLKAPTFLRKPLHMADLQAALRGC